MARRLGDSSSGPRTLGYDANPRGLAGTSSGRGLAGTTSSATDYKKAKQNKNKEKEEQVQVGSPPPYDDDNFTDSPITPFSEAEWEDQNGIEPYTANQPKIKDAVKFGEGKGWVLKLHFKKSEVEKLLGKKLNNKVSGTLTGLETSWLYIRDVSDKRQIKLPTSPLENGMIKHDHKVLMPKTLRISGLVGRDNSKLVNVLLEYASYNKSLEVYFELSSPWKNYRKMYLSGHNSKASNRMYDMYEYSLDLTELLFASDLKDKTDDAELASNTDKGAASGK